MKTSVIETKEETPRGVGGGEGMRVLSYKAASLQSAFDMCECLILPYNPYSRYFKH